MPFALSHKASKGKLRPPASSPLDLTNLLGPNEQGQGQHGASYLPTPPPSADSPVFKMFSWKKKTQNTTSSVYPAEPPKPILKGQTSPSVSSPSIRFGSSTQGSRSPASLMELPSPQAIRMATLSMPIPSPVPPPSGRRSSRPTSPSASSFGKTMTTRSSHSTTLSTASSMSMSTPPMNGLSYITTPPTAYVPSMQNWAPPPPSPYRPTSERSRASSFSQPLPNVLTSGDNMANRTPRHSSLFASSESVKMINHVDHDVPMLNIIPATPQACSSEFADNGDGWHESGATMGRTSSSAPNLQESATIDQNDESTDIGSDSTTTTFEGGLLPHMPSIDVELDFTPFQMDELSTSTSSSLCDSPTITLPSEDDLPPSPPFQSYSYLPSLASQASLSSETSMTTSSSAASLLSFPDVEQALGSMLASLSDQQLHEIQLTPTIHCKEQQQHHQQEDGLLKNPGLGLGLDIPDTASLSITPPLSPARRRGPPAPLDLGRLSNINVNSATMDKTNYHEMKQSVQTAPPHINHRVAFYQTAKAAPNSPTSGIFTECQTSFASLDLNLGLSQGLCLGKGHGQGPVSHVGQFGQTGQMEQTWSNAAIEGSNRDSLSMESEFSDEELHTASIISLTPMLGDRMGVEIRGEEGEVGVAL